MTRGGLLLAGALSACANENAPTPSGAAPTAMPGAAPNDMLEAGPPDTGPPPLIRVVSTTVNCVRPQPDPTSPLTRLTDQRSACPDVDLGPYAELLCLLSRVSGPTEGYNVDYRYWHTDMPDYINEYCGGLSTKAEVVLDPADSHWKLRSISEDEGYFAQATNANDAYLLAHPDYTVSTELAQYDGGLKPPVGVVETSEFSASATCVSWAALGLTAPPKYARLDLPVQGLVASGPLPGASSTCFVSQVADDFSNALAAVGSSQFTIMSTMAPRLTTICEPVDSGEVGATGSVSCFEGLPTVDLPVTDQMALPSGICGLSAVGGLRVQGSVVDVSLDKAAVDGGAQATARCVLVGSQ